MPLVDLSREELQVLGAFAGAISTLSETTGDAKLAEARPLLDAVCSKFRSVLEEPQQPRYFAFCTNPHGDGLCWWEEDDLGGSPCVEAECDCTPAIYAGIPVHQEAPDA